MSHRWDYSYDQSWTCWGNETGKPISEETALDDQELKIIVNWSLETSFGWCCDHQSSATATTSVSGGVGPAGLGSFLATACSRDFNNVGWKSKQVEHLKMLLLQSLLLLLLFLHVSYPFCFCGSVFLFFSFFRSFVRSSFLSVFLSFCVFLSFYLSVFLSFLLSFLSVLPSFLPSFCLSVFLSFCPPFLSFYQPTIHQRDSYQNICQHSKYSDQSPPETKDHGTLKFYQCHLASSVYRDPYIGLL